MAKTDFKSVDEYISTFPDTTQNLLEQVRATIKAAAPDAEERISYQMPAYFLEGRLIYFAGYKTHIGIYGVSGAMTEYKDEIAPLLQAKSTIAFPHKKPLPLDLLTRIVKFGVAENTAKAAAKTKTK